MVFGNEEWLSATLKEYNLAKLKLLKEFLESQIEFWGKTLAEAQMELIRSNRLIRFLTGKGLKEISAAEYWNKCSATELMCDAVELAKRKVEERIKELSLPA